jgi:hypothetical protein
MVQSWVARRGWRGQNNSWEYMGIY